VDQCQLALLILWFTEELLPMITVELANHLWNQVDAVKVIVTIFLTKKIFFAQKLFFSADKYFLRKNDFIGQKLVFQSKIIFFFAQK